MFEPLKDLQVPVLECKDCHRPVKGEESVAYHLVDMVLYGWCQLCFDHRGQNAQLDVLV
jgi:hypothetical protein